MVELKSDKSQFEQVVVDNQLVVKLHFN